jgi:hypothetical protein
MLKLVVYFFIIILDVGPRHPVFIGNLLWGGAGQGIEPPPATGPPCPPH